MTTLLGAPIRHGDKALGNLYLSEKAGGEDFLPEDEQLMVAVASRAALAIRNAGQCLREQETRQQVEEARRALAKSEATLRGNEQQLRDVRDNTATVIYIKEAEDR